MTSKHYVLFAKAFLYAKPAKACGVPWECDRASVADALARDNPHFNRETFISATEGN